MHENDDENDIIHESDDQNDVKKN